MLGDFHWIIDGVGGLLLALVVLIIAFAACRTYFERRLETGLAQPSEPQVEHEHD